MYQTYYDLSDYYRSLSNPTSSLVQEVRQNASQYGLMPYYQQVLLALQLHHDALQAVHNVLVALASWIPKTGVVRECVRV